MITSFIHRLSKHLNLPVRDFFWVLFLKRALYCFLIFKIIFSWSVLRDVLTYAPFHFNSTLAYIGFAPLLLAKSSIDVFLVSFLVILISGLVIRNSYLISFSIFWFSVCLSRFAFLLMNGSDQVLNVFLLLTIFMVPTGSKFFIRPEIVNVVSNAAMLVARLQIAIVYLASGYDKLLSVAWRSGEAIYSISQLSFFQNPWFVVELSQTACRLVGWVVILFELLFAVLIWFKRCKKPLLLVGAGFHLWIIVGMGLLDFGALMIICYSIYLPVRHSEETSSV